MYCDDFRLKGLQDGLRNVSIPRLTAKHSTRSTEENVCIVMIQMSVSEVNRCRCVSTRVNLIIEKNRMSLRRRRVRSVSIAPNWSDIIPTPKNIPSSECLNYDQREFARLFRACDIEKLHIVNMDLTQSFMASFLSLVINNRITIAQFNFGMCKITCDPVIFCRLMEVVQLKELSIRTCTVIDDEFSALIIASKAAKKLTRLAIGLPSRISDGYLLSTNLSWLAVKDTIVTTKAVRMLILEWLNGRKQFDYIGISTIQKLETELILASLDYYQVDSSTVILENRDCEKMALSLDENSFVMYNRNAERIMIELEESTCEDELIEFI
ncbi:hypothetical protein DICVIV_03095 [Dictyocaulus viviparus]|uniref:F-box domain protein n=1 Tax=Dictyocaulus viviparus TaxID=29172 RepID=A0A0D8Y1N8_DICVI|nr:hypothetical protein DICVIV_03095 [Dictyocaulus viviparus]